MPSGAAHLPAPSACPCALPVSPAAWPEPWPEGMSLWGKCHIILAGIISPGACQIPGFTKKNPKNRNFFSLKSHISQTQPELPFWRFLVTRQMSQRTRREGGSSCLTPVHWAGWVPDLVWGRQKSLWLSGGEQGLGLSVSRLPCWSKAQRPLEGGTHTAPRADDLYQGQSIFRARYF